jgi:hypothetical protein
MTARPALKVRRIVDEGLLSALVTDLRAQQAFPVFRQAALSIASVRTCCGRRHAHHSVDMRALKQRVLNLDAEATKRLKTFLGVDVLVFYRQGPGGLVTVEK